MESSREIHVGFSGLRDHISKNMNLYIISFLFVVVGVVIGVISVRNMSIVDKEYALNWIGESMNSPEISSVKRIDILLISIKNYIPVVLCIWFLGLTVIGAPFVLICNIVKGYSMGYSFFFMVSNFGKLGVLVGLGAVVLQNLFFIPCIMEMSVNSMELSLKIVREKQEKISVEKIITYTMKIGMTSLIMVFGCLVETFITPYILRLLLPYI